MVMTGTSGRRGFGRRLDGPEVVVQEGRGLGGAHLDEVPAVEEDESQDPKWT
jgi:hypothetical protein